MNPRWLPCWLFAVRHRYVQFYCPVEGVRVICIGCGKKGTM